MSTISVKEFELNRSRTAGPDRVCASSANDVCGGEEEVCCFALGDGT
jgi:hypothetical protein